MQSVSVSNWTELLEALYQDTWDPGIRRFRSPYVFRGSDSRAGSLRTGLVRLSEGHQDIRALERHLLRNFRKYATGEFPAASSDWRLLPFAQHHGLPTRLLDWTYSPLIAAHFTTEDPECFGQDGAIWLLNHRRSGELLPPRLKQLAEREGGDVFTAEMLEGAAATMDQFDNISDGPCLLFIEPPSLDMRIANQFALFSVTSPPDLDFQQWLESHSELAREIVIPASAKLEIRDKLDQAGITERIIFPGPDGLARWLSRYYRSV